MCKECNAKPVFIMLNGRKLCKKCFCNYFEKKIYRTIRKHNLINKEDKIAVAASGGKDSIVVLYILNKFCKQRKQKIAAFAIDEGISYRKNLLAELQKFCKKEKIPLKILSFKKEYGCTLEKLAPRIKKLGLSNCYVCSILKKWLINKKAMHSGFTKISTGHSLDDAAETFILNVMKGNSQLIAKSGPESGILQHKKFVQRIKPLYFCLREEIILYAKIKNLPLSLNVSPLRTETFKVSIRHFLFDMEKKYPNVKYAIVNSFLPILSKLKEKYDNKKIRECKKCKWPSSREICKRCQLVRKLKLKDR